MIYDPVPVGKLCPDLSRGAGHLHVWGSEHVVCCQHQRPDGTLAAFTIILQTLETIMTNQAEAFAALGAKDDALLEAVQDLAGDFVAFRDAMAAERENLTPAGQAAFDEASAKADAAAAALHALDDAVGDADGSDTPPPSDTPEGDTTPPSDGSGDTDASAGAHV